MPWSRTMGAAMMMSERQKSPRGMMRLTSWKGRSSAGCRSVRTSSGDAVWDQDITNTANGLQIERELGIFLDLTAKPRHLHVDRSLERHAEARAEIGARKRPAGICREQLQ